MKLASLLSSALLPMMCFHTRPCFLIGRYLSFSAYASPRVLLTLISLYCLFFLGCPLLTLAPKSPDIFIYKGTHNYSSTSYLKDKADYKVAIGGGNILLATEYRDNMLWSIINDVDYNYNEFKTAFSRDRATVQTFGDLAQLGLSTAATALSGSVILSAAVTALKGAELSIDKNYFDEKASTVLFTKMDSLREVQMAEIQKKLQLSPPGYGFEEAYRDTLRLFSAGTVSTALQSITADAGQKQATASQQIQQAIDERIHTLQPTTAALRDAREQLTDALKPLAADPIAAYGKVQAALQALHKDASPKPADALGQLQAAILNAWTEPEVNAIKAIFVRLGIMQ